MQGDFQGSSKVHLQDKVLLLLVDWVH
jgi:hypothetical protein